MKNTLTILFLLVNTALISQVDVDTVFTQKQVIRIYNYIDSLEITNTKLNKNLELNNLLIEQYKNENAEYEYLSHLDDKLIKLKDDRIQNMQKSIQAYKDYIKADKKNFIEKPVVWFFIGVISAYTSYRIVANIK
jgi:phage antirepressor YoqD-like protein